VPGPASTKRSVPSLAGQTGEPRVKHNASIPSLADQFLAAEAAVVATSVPTMSTMPTEPSRGDAGQLSDTSNSLTVANEPTIPTMPMTPMTPTMPAILTTSTIQTMIQMMTPMTIPMTTPMTIPTIQTGPTELNRDDAGQFGDTAKSLDPYRSDEDLGDLDWRFSDDKGRFAMDEEVHCLNSWLVIMDLDNRTEHVLHGSRAELYLADNLRNLKHSFENANEVPNVQTNPVRSIHYPQGRDDFTEELSVVRSTGSLFHKFFKDLKLLVPSMIKFVIRCGMRDLERDGDLMQNDDDVADDSNEDNGPTQNRRVIFSCCGQAFSTEYVDGHCAPRCTYGLHVFDKNKDKEERDLMKAMIADALDCMQKCEDYIEIVELKNPLPFSDPRRDERFAKQVWDFLGCLKFRRQDITIQLKNLTQGGFIKTIFGISIETFCHGFIGSSSVGSSVGIICGDKLFCKNTLKALLDAELPLLVAFKRHFLLSKVGIATAEATSKKRKAPN
jgi:hypothetical protein